MQPCEGLRLCLSLWNRFLSWAENENAQRLPLQSDPPVTSDRLPMQWVAQTHESQGGVTWTQGLLMATPKVGPEVGTEVEGIGVLERGRRVWSKPDSFKM